MNSNNDDYNNNNSNSDNDNYNNCNKNSVTWSVKWILC